MKDKMVYKGNNFVGDLMNVPIFVGTFSVVMDFAVLENTDAYRDEGMGDVILGEPFLREVGIKTKWLNSEESLGQGFAADSRSHYRGLKETIRDKVLKLKNFKKDAALKFFKSTHQERPKLGKAMGKPFPPPYTGNFMPPTPDLSFTGLDEFVNKPVIENSKAMPSKEEPKVFRKYDDAPSIEEWVSDDEKEDVSQPKTEKKIVMPSIVKKEFVKSRGIQNGFKMEDNVVMEGTSNEEKSKKSYIKTVVIDDYSGFTWVFFLATKDETSGILKSFITGIENLVDHKVKFIRCDNGTEFKNREMNQFCVMKGILRQFSAARTPQQNGVAEKRNRTLIKAARTMLADSKYKNSDNTSSHDDGSKSSSDDGKKVDEDPRKESECKDQEKEDNVNCTNNVNTVSSIVNVAGTNEVNVVGGKTSIELLFDPNMPALEDDSIFDFSRDDER
ncbi:ribonuclease H-like domain-containing protein [Tanacetum coccineum]